MEWLRYTALSAAAVLIIGGCGGGSNSRDDTASGGIVDGYVAGATVFADADGNGVWGEGELKTVSDDNGDFSLEGTIVGGTAVYGSGGTDLSSGLPFEGRLKSIYRSGEPLILSPLTTYVAALLTDSNSSWDDAAAAVAERLGIDPGLVNGDPMENAGAFLAAQKVQKVVEVVAAATAGAGETFEVSYEAVFASLAKIDADFNASTLVTQVATDRNITIDTAVNTFVETLVATIDEIGDRNVSTDDLDTVGSVINTYAEVAEGAIENNESLDAVTQQLDALDTSGDLAAQAQSLEDALKEVEDALEGLHYLGANTADDRIVFDLNLSDSAAAPFNTADLNLTWSSSDSAVNVATGAVTRSDTADVEVALKARVDNAQVTNSRTYHLVVKRNEYAPVAENDAALLDEDGNVTIDVTANDSDANGDALAVTPLGAPSHGTATYHGDGTVTYVPESNYNGSDSFTYTLTDATGRSDTATVTLTVASVNDAPAISGTPALSVKQNTTYTFTPVAGDVDGDTLTFSIENQPTWADFDTATGTLSGTPSPANVGVTGGIVISVSDGTAMASLAAFDLEVTATAVPVAESFAASTDEDTAVQIDVVSHASDSDGTIDPATVSTSPASHGALAVNPTTGGVTYTPAADYNGADSFTYTVQDNEGALSNTATVSVTVNPVNDAPVLATLASIALIEGNSATVTASASDVDGDTITYSASSSNSGVAAVSVSGNQVIVSAVSAGLVTITVTASDGLLQDSETFTVTVSSAPAPSDMTWYNGKEVYGFWLETNESAVTPSAEHFILNGGTLDVTMSRYDIVQQTWSDAPYTPDGIILVDGTWQTEPSDLNYTISPDGTELTLNGREIIRVKEANDLSGQTVVFGNHADVSISVTFSEGATHYVMESRLLSDRYELSWQPENMGIGFSSIEDFMNTGWSFYWSDTAQTGVGPRMNASGTAAVDSNGSDVVTLTAGMQGDLVDMNGTVVGSWRAEALPGQTEPSIRTSLEVGIANYDEYMQWGEIFITMYSGNVWLGEYKPASDTFTVDAETGYVQGNEQAMLDIKAAVEAYDFSGGGSSTTPTANDASIVGAWALPGEDKDGNPVPYGALLVVIDNAHYFMTQQTLGEGGNIGGVEVGGYTLDNGAFTLANPVINTNAGDTATCGTMTENGDGSTALFAENAVCDGQPVVDPGEVNATRVADAAHPEAGAWIARYNETADGNFGFIAMVLDGNGHYMVADIDVRPAWA